MSVALSILIGYYVHNNNPIKIGERTWKNGSVQDVVE